MTNDENIIIVNDGQVTKQNLSPAFAGVLIEKTAKGLQIHIPANKIIPAPLIMVYQGEKSLSFVTDVKVEGDSCFELAQLILHEGIINIENTVALLRAGANAKVKTIALATHAQEQEITTKVTNHAPHTAGDIVNYGVVKHEARLVFNGIGKVDRGAHEAQAFQESRGMILSENAHMEANPQLLIDEYDVKAGHGASIGQIDEEQLYYLMSRGLTYEEAETLIIHGFLIPFISELKNETLRQQLLDSVTSRVGAS